ncbi:MAG: sulfurtransferase [Croceitalea sp.]|nr:sulfurtransferase [Croceitalea sp.]
MRFKNSLWVLGAIVVLLSCKKGPEKTMVAAHEPSQNLHLMEVADVISAEGEDTFLLIDFRTAEAYEKGHIEGALNFWRPHIEDTSYAYKGMMAPKKQIEALFSKLGIQNNDHLVVYDHKGSSDAARLWWLLQSYGFERVSILNGGYQAWLDAGGKLSIEPIARSTSTFTLPEQEGLHLWIDHESLVGRLPNLDGIVLVDARTADEYSGKRKKEGAAKAGRIPGSVHMDWANAIDLEGSHKFKPLPQLQAIYGGLGASKEDTLIVYCHTGVRSAHTTFVLHALLGYGQVKNYDGSWSQWSHLNELPFEKDSITLVNK